MNLSSMILRRVTIVRVICIFKLHKNTRTITYVYDKGLNSHFLNSEEINGLGSRSV